jgi:hypothetical protein
MSWVDKVLEAIKGAAIIADRVERLGAETADLARELRDLDRRLARLEGIVFERGPKARDGPRRIG